MSTPRDDLLHHQRRFDRRLARMRHLLADAAMAAVARHMPPGTTLTPLVRSRIFDDLDAPLRAVYGGLKGRLYRSVVAECRSARRTAVARQRNAARRQLGRRAPDVLSRIDARR